ncbi:DNA modification methylase, partial [Escherichia coli]|nr:DNA modification methylase [Escherichia coli]EFD0698908.1 DNA modification methylase [Escherichia coli]
YQFLVFIDRNLNPKKIKKTPKNGCLFNTACVP